MQLTNNYSADNRKRMPAKCVLKVAGVMMLSTAFTMTGPINGQTVSHATKSDLPRLIDPRSATPSSVGGKVSGGTSFADYALYSGVLAARLGDFISTEQVLSHHGHEDLLPAGLVHNKPAFAGYSLGAGVAEILASRMIRKSHPKLARGMLMVDIGGTGAAVGHNLAVTNWRIR